MMENWIQDVRIAGRSLRRSPGFALIAIVTLALGIGANTAIFSVVNTVLLRPLPYADPDRLVTVSHMYPSLNNLEAGAAVPTYADLRSEAGPFESVAVMGWWQPNLTGDGDAERLAGSLVSGEFFSTLGASAARGRTVLPDDAEAGARVVVLSHGLWNRRFGADPGVIGGTARINGENYEIVGVMPAGFVDVTHPQTDLWAPLAFEPAQFTARTEEFLTMIARLAPGVTLPQARQEMAAFASRLKQEHAGIYPSDWTLVVGSLADLAVGNVRPALLLLLGAVGLVLLIACANVANLLLARAAARAKEIAVRRALGAKGTHLVRQLLSESLLLSLAGAALALLLAFGAIRLLVALNPTNLPRVEAVSIDATVMLFTLGVAVLTGVLFGLAPVLQVTRIDLQSTLRQGGRSGSGDGGGQVVRRALVVAEIALALTLLIGAGLLIRSFAQIQRVDPGFNPDHVLTANLALPPTTYASPEERIAFFNELLPRIAALPGVQEVGATSNIPFGGTTTNRSFQVEGLQPAPDEPDPWGQYRVVDPGFHRTLQIPLVRGRFFSEQDRIDAQPVALINPEAANRFWPGEDPVGKRIAYEAHPETGEPVWIEVVGVVGHSAHARLDERVAVQIYRPFAQVGSPYLTLAIRTTGDPMRLAGALRETVRSVDPGLPVAQVRTLEDLLGNAVGQRRFSMLLLGLFAGIALLLAAIGIYGVVSFDVARRAREMGIRMALGAERGSILSLVLGRGLKLTLVGVAIGMAGAFALMRVIESQLYGVGSRDPLTFAAVAGLLLGIALLAALVPALRATRVDPMMAMRAE